MAKSVLTIDGFFSGAKAMRSEYETRFANPREANSERFIWDWWHVSNQYTALRTPAYHFFSKKLYESFHNQLVWWGRRTLGCHDVSPPWMSCYIDGCNQQLHGDLPHGPWAFVFSLTPWAKRKFTGGETILLRDEMLSYWKDFSSARSLEKQDIIQEVPALFNRLTVFDPRIPHGVSEVRGPRDVLDGRLVIHGWFVQPRPFIEGPLATGALQTAINDLSGSLNDLFTQGLDVTGVLSLKISITKTGIVNKIDVLTNVVRHPENDARIPKALVAHVRGFLRKCRFPKTESGSRVTLPLVFER